MKSEPTRREFLNATARGAGLVALGSTAAYLVIKAGPDGYWQVDPRKCVNIRLGAVNVEVCDKCATTCVLPLSAVRAVNEYAKCGRCCICPSYFDVTSEIGRDGLPTRKLCPRDAITREAIGDVDPDDPLNNFYDYHIDEDKCDGCGKCVMACKEPSGLGSLRLEVRHSLCVDCNRCTIATACPDDALVRDTNDLSKMNPHPEEETT
jgi:electron transport complex protein RnfB